MVNLILLIIIRSIDLPLTENNPFLVIKLKKDYLEKINNNKIKPATFIGRNLIELELNYLLSVGLYEYHLLLWLREVNKSLPLWKKIWYDLCLILTTVYSRRFNIAFIIGSILLPIVFYFFFLLIDYYEVMEEFMEIINEKLKANS